MFDKHLQKDKCKMIRTISLTNIFSNYVFENFQLHKTFTHYILNYIGHSFEVTSILKKCMRRKYLLFTRTRASVALFEKSRK